MSVFVCYFSHKTGVLGTWEDYNIGQAPFLSHNMRGGTIILLTLSLRQCLSGFCTVKLLFFPFPTLGFGSELPSLVHPQGSRGQGLSFAKEISFT